MRRFANRVKKNVIMSSWFIILTIITAWALILLAHVISTDPELSQSELLVKPNTFLMFVFLILTGKALIDTLHRAIESKELVVLLAQPIQVRKVVFGKYLGVLFSNLLIVTYALVLMTVIQVGSFHVDFVADLTITSTVPDGSNMKWVGGYGINHFQILDVIILSITASTMGFVYSIINSLPLKRRIIGIVTQSLLLAPMWIVMREIDLVPLHQTLVLAAIMLLSLLSLVPAGGSFLEAWTKQTSGKKAMFFQKRSWGALHLLDRLFSPSISKLVRKELVINVQKKEIMGNLIAILGLSVLLLWGWHRIEGLNEIPEKVADIAYPAIISIGIYLAAVLQCGLIGLGSIGKEGKRFWILKQMPVHPEKMFWAKAVAILSLSPVTILGVSLPLPIILGYSMTWSIFFVIMTISLIMAFTGIGLLMGAMYPNFDESTGGMPDVMSMYLLMLICLMIGGGMLIFAGYALSSDIINGVLSSAIVLELSLMILILGIKGGAWFYIRLEQRPN